MNPARVIRISNWASPSPLSSPLVPCEAIPSSLQANYIVYHIYAYRQVYAPISKAPIDFPSSVAGSQRVPAPSLCPGHPSEVARNIPSPPRRQTAEGSAPRIRLRRAHYLGYTNQLQWGEGNAGQNGREGLTGPRGPKWSRYVDIHKLNIIVYSG